MGGREIVVKKFWEHCKSYPLDNQRVIIHISILRALGSSAINKLIYSKYIFQMYVSMESPHLCFREYLCHRIVWKMLF